MPQEGLTLVNLLSALVILAGTTNLLKKGCADMFVRTDPGISVERLAEAVRSVGKVESRVKGTRIFLVQLNSGVDEDKVRDNLEHISGVHPLEPSEEPFDMSSVRSLDRKIAHMEQDDVEIGQSDESKKTGRRADEVDYLKAYRYFISQRAFPNDSVNWSALAPARDHVSKMRPTVIGGRSQSGSRPSLANIWQFLGPSILAPPYLQYYGPGAVTGRVNAVAYDPSNSNTLYAGGAQGGIWKSIDAGATWSWLSSSWPMLGVNCIVVDPRDSATIYVGLGDYHGEIGGCYGIMKTTDGGSTWAEISSQTTGKVGVARILLDPTNDQILIAGTGDVGSIKTAKYGSLYRSVDGGKTWSPLSVGGNTCTWPALAASAPSGSSVRFYAVAGGLGPAGNGNSRCYKSDDHGATWQALPSPVVTDGTFHWAYSVATSPTNSKNVYVLDSEHQPQKEALFTSANQGATWKNVSANLPLGPFDQSTGGYYNWSQCWYDYDLECGSRAVGSSAEDVLYLGEIDITESVDGGNSWISIGGPVYDAKNAVTHSDQHCLAVCPTNPDHLLIGNDGGIYSVVRSSTSNQSTVTSLNANLGLTMFYKIACDPMNPDVLLGGTQDNATPLSSGADLTWWSVVGGDGGGCAINQTNSHIQYATVDGFHIYRTSDSWLLGQTDISPADLSTTYANLLASQNLPFVTPISLAPQNQSLLYTATNYLWRWDDAAQTWTPDLGGTDLTNGVNGATVRAISIAPTDLNRIYTGSSDGALYMSTSEGTSWVKLNAESTNLPLASITSILVNPANESDILVGLSGTGLGSGHLWRCSNTQATVPSFTAVSGTGLGALPDVSLNAITLDAFYPSTTWWVGTDMGVFETTDSGASWSNASAPLGLPNVIIDDLVTVPGTGYLNAGTYGRGIWSLLNSGTNLSAFTLSPIGIFTGGTATGTVTMSAPAPLGGVSVALSSSIPATVQVPPSVFIAEGSTTNTFTLTGTLGPNGPYYSTISATYNGTTLTQNLVVYPLQISRLDLTPNYVTGGASATGTVVLPVPALPGGSVVTLGSNTPSAIVPPTVTVPAGALTASFTVTTVPVSVATDASITATLGYTASTGLSINPPGPSSLTVSPQIVVSGTTSIGTVTLNGVSPPGGQVVYLSSNSATAVPPVTVTVPAGATSASFSITTAAVAASTAVTITANASELSATAILTVVPGELANLSLSPASVVGGVSSTGTITLSTPAPTGGVTISLSSSASTAVPPGSDTVPAGGSTATFEVTTDAVSTAVSATITATLGSTTATASLAITPVSVSGLVVAPSTVAGGNMAVGTVSLNGPAATGGVAVNLASSNSDARCPSSVFVAAGSTSATFGVSTSQVASAVTITITATQGGNNVSANLVVNPVGLVSISVVGPILGGKSTTGVVTLDGEAPKGGIRVKLSSNSKFAKPPASVLVPSAATSVGFTVSTSAVGAVTNAVLSGSQGANAATSTLTIDPPVLSSFSFSPAAVVGSKSSTGSLTLSSPAPAGGILVLLSSDQSCATVPASVKVPGGAVHASFLVKTTAVGAQTVAIVSASLNGQVLPANLTINPPILTGFSLSPTSVIGGKEVNGMVTLGTVAPSGGTVVALTSGSDLAAAPTTVTVQAGQTKATLKVVTMPVKAGVTVTLTASLGSVVKTAKLQIQK